MKHLYQRPLSLESFSLGGKPSSSYIWLMLLLLIYLLLVVNDPKASDVGKKMYVRKSKAKRKCKNQHHSHDPIWEKEQCLQKTTTCSVEVKFLSRIWPHFSKKLFLPPFPLFPPEIISFSHPFLFIVLSSFQKHILIFWVAFAAISLSSCTNSLSCVSSKMSKKSNWRILKSIPKLPAIRNAFSAP